MKASDQRWDRGVPPGNGRIAGQQRGWADGGLGRVRARIRLAGEFGDIAADFRAGVHEALGRYQDGLDGRELTGDYRQRVLELADDYAARVRRWGLGELSGAEVDKAGRLTVEGDLTLPDHPEVIALGDMVRVRGTDGEPVTYPGVAPVGIQQGRYAGKLVADRLAGRTTKPFHYFDKGNLATIGRGRAVAQIKFLKVSGLPAWLLWLGVHLFYLIGFQNRLLVLIKWSISFFTHGRSARIITDQPSDDVPRARAG